MDESIQNIVAFSFSVLNGGIVNSSSNLFTNDSLNRDIIQLQWETVNRHFRGFITVTAENNGLHQMQGHNTSEGAMRYRFTVNTTDLGEGPLLLTLYIKLRCKMFSGLSCAPDWVHRCSCTQWQYEGESETVSVSAKQGGSIGIHAHNILYRIIMQQQAHPVLEYFMLYKSLQILYFNCVFTSVNCAIIVH